MNLREPSVVEDLSAPSALHRCVVIHKTQPLNCFEHFFELLGALGFEVVVRDYEFETFAPEPHTIHLVWSLPFDVKRSVELSKRPDVFFLENGWLSQNNGFCLDADGTNVLSSMPGELNSPNLGQPNESLIEAYLLGLHENKKLNPVTDEGDYLFVPLQTETDSQIRLWSGCRDYAPHRQRWFAQQVCEAFPNHKLIVRPHPHDVETTESILESDFIESHGNVHLRTDGTCYDWAAGSRAVVGINSTVLIEALTLFKPVCAFGEGVFSGNRVVMECGGKPEALPAILSYQPDRKQIIRFMALLLERQIPYNIKAHQIARYPVLIQMLETARTFTGEDEIIMASQGLKEKAKAEPVGITVPHIKTSTPSIILGNLFEGSLMDALCTTPLPKKLVQEKNVDVYLTDNPITRAVFANNPYVKGFVNLKGMQLSSQLKGDGHICQQLQRGLGLTIDSAPKPELYLSEDEIQWAKGQRESWNTNKPICLLSSRYKEEVADRYIGIDWDAIGKVWSQKHFIIQPILGESDQCGLEIDGTQPAEQFIRKHVIKDAVLCEKLTIRQYIALFSVANVFCGGLSDASQLAAAFEIPALIIGWPTLHQRINDQVSNDTRWVYSQQAVTSARSSLGMSFKYGLV